MSNFQPAMTGQGRVFINSSVDICHTLYDFHACMSVTSLSRSSGDVTSVVCPSSTKFNAFDEVATVQSPATRWTSALSGMLPVNVESPLEAIERDSRVFNMQVHYGECQAPSDFNDFTSALVMSNVLLTSYSLGELTALTADAISFVPESADVSVRDYFRVFNLNWAEIVSVGQRYANAAQWCRNPTCGGDDNSYYALCMSFDPIVAGVPQVHISVDNAITWSTFNTVTAQDASIGIQNMSVECNGNVALLMYTADGTGGSTILETTLTGLAQGSPVFSFAFGTSAQDKSFQSSFSTETHIYYLGGQGQFAVATGGSYIVEYNKQTKQFTEIDDHEIFPNSLTEAGATWVDGDSIDSDHVVIVGTKPNGGTLQGVPFAYSTTQGVFTRGNIVVNGSPVLAPVRKVHMLSESSWIVWVFDVNNNVVCTEDYGQTWRVIGELTLEEQPAPDSTVFAGVLGYTVKSDGIYRSLDLFGTNKLVNSTYTATVNSYSVAAHPTNPNLILATVAHPTTGEGTILRGAI